MTRACARALAVVAVSALAFAAPAAAQPPGFPDLDGFTAVDSTTYQSPRHWGDTTFFSTPGGVRCLMASYTGIDCGAIAFAVPGIAPDAGGGCTWVGLPSVPASASNPKPYEFKHQPEQCLQGNPDKLLPTGSKISHVVDGVPLYTCAVGPEDLLACIDSHRHGFVLQPSGSTTF